ncbi:MAG: 2-amino-4-hydroxy-6-hydroxymethyldihydropteridine diphosphokinase [Shewanella sp.]|uniref:2-amino-4-hydroxy-6- hydroxymethyldihydropteridine diphosphokinase n=1 Tax=unclassified Shewanella TaxID=196818 RepID=UPI0021D87036|nr:MULTISPECIES: 2-amino-4-hydroxy-6-hydroxymethyldihydropteridine diphosphokinase [unclassified Shewanella]MCU8011537.1 2-amino-4-hydroxy-6-hydroxymethyldihydropteridine diphosphokinase [Shewanella sp. SM74]MCU8032624.1 2-amino-4-hydroxy-6-hydroxymethyldihydropteridine diphosphokinase [Shewanella sp. SM71]MCU8094510.1 2-amino-4-hydroxy-6-hydroxymethyldihydropteridine diphosphokinase [Shewanella sp. SM102]
MARIYISLGSNIEPEQHLQAGLISLRACFGPLRLSSMYESEAVGFSGTNFLNMVASVETDLNIAAVVAQFKQIEQNHGRLVGAKKFSPRTLDLDLLLYDHVVCETPVTLPRAEIVNNAFVLWPLAELAPELIHPVVDKSYASLWQEYDKESQRLWPVMFEWPQGLTF